MSILTNPAALSIPRLGFLADERRDLLLPDLKRVRQTGRESRGRAGRRGFRGRDRTRAVGAVRRPAGRRARLLQARGEAIPRARRGSLAALALTAALAGCGDGRLSHGDFVKRADAVCTAYNNATSATKRPRTYAQIVAYVRKTLPL